MRPEIKVGELDSLLTTLVDDFSREVREATLRRGLFAIAIPGGSVAVHGCPALAEVPVDWNCTHIFWVDERAVSHADPQSNYGVAHALWLGPAGAPSESIHPMPADAQDLAAAAASYSDELTGVVGAQGRLDYVLLGVGPDGHVASLFPGHAALLEADRLVVAIEDAPKPPARRLSLTLSTLTRAERLVVMAFGDSKSAVMQEAIESPDSPLPLARVLRRASRSLVLLDPGAASLL